MFRKIITYFLILAVVLPVLAGAVPLRTGGAGWGVNRARAEALVPKEGYGNGTVSSPCDLNIVTGVLKGLHNTVNNVLGVTPYFQTSSVSIWHCSLYTITYLLYEVVMRISIWIAGFASDLFNVSIQFSLTGKVFDASENGNIMIKDGWTMVRDLLNLVFIFILLFAAISTILQYGNIDIKKILPSLIVAALLVNFSLMIAKMVIDASHIFAWEFYNQIDVTNKEGLGQSNSKEIFANMQGSVNMKGNFEKKNLANVFLAGFNPQRLLVESEIVSEDNTKSVLPAWREVYEHATGKSQDIIDTLWRMILIILLESALALFASFILLAGAIMFVARVVVLWIVMIFSPLAFLSMILPSMGKYSSMWWKYLIDQSFFAPAFLFMFMLATKFINNKLVDSLLKADPNNDSKIVEGLHMGEIVVIFFNFFVVAFIFSLCLVVARQLGGKTAEFGISWAHKGKELALGGANALAFRPLARHTMGRGFDMMAKSDWAQKMAARFPVIGGGLYKTMQKGAGVGGYDKVMEDKIKLGKSLKTAELRAQYYDKVDARTQKEWYQKASSRERVELHDKTSKRTQSELDQHFKTLSAEEQEKTIKARAEIYTKKKTEDIAKAFLRADEALQREILNQLKDDKKPEFVEELERVATQPAQALQNMGIDPQKLDTTLASSVGNQLKSINPLLAGRGLQGLAMNQAISNAASTIKATKTRNLSHTARMNRNVIKTLSKAHVEDLIKSGTLDDIEAKEIYDTVFDVLQQNPNDQWGNHILNYMEKGPSKDFWNSL